MPVVDAGDRLVGVITVDDIVDVISEEAEEDIKALGGVQRRGRAVRPRLVDRAKAGFNWLLINLADGVPGLVGARPVRGPVEKMVALAVLAPIVASQGGNAGDADHDGRGACAGDAGAIERTMRGASSGAS